MDIDKSAMEYLKEYPTDWLVIDLINERYNLLKSGKGYALYSKQFVACGCEDTISEYEIIDRQCLIKDFVDEKIQKFCEEIKKFIQQSELY